MVQLKVINLPIMRRHLLGEDLGNLGPKELDQLETVLDTSLKQIRLKQLEETNVAIRETWQQGERNMPYRPLQPAQPEAFFEPLGCNSTAQIPYRSSAPNNAAENAKGMLPGWMHTLHVLILNGLL
ncbi:MADS-box protein [Sesamum angolense]|uniref:MADS-box protein n=1 Tax=Sesamum angolense TaxID=2727404 RepID=A0AAE1XEG8_9LAMI|nr:MADS-box protein [Sesamum angolense]